MRDCVVEFVCYSVDGREGPTATALADACEIPIATAMEFVRKNQRVRVTAEQFGIFIVRRAGLLENNQIRHLNAMLVDPPAQQKIIIDLRPAEEV